MSKLQELIQHTYISECGNQPLPGTLKIWTYTQLIIYTTGNLNFGMLYPQNMPDDLKEWHLGSFPNLLKNVPAILDTKCA